jgi:hypothetical protein
MVIYIIYKSNTIYNIFVYIEQCICSITLFKNKYTYKFLFLNNFIFFIYLYIRIHFM